MKTKAERALETIETIQHLAKNLCTKGHHCGEFRNVNISRQKTIGRKDSIQQFHDKEAYLIETIRVWVNKNQKSNRINSRESIIVLNIETAPTR